MTAKYRVIVHYHFKKGMEEKGVKFLEKELIQKGLELGCHYIELWQHEKDLSRIEGIATWNSLEEAKQFQMRWDTKEKEFIKLFCMDKPKRVFCKLRQCYVEKSRKAA